MARQDNAMQAYIQRAIETFMKRKGSVVYGDLANFRNDIDVKGVTLDQIAVALRAMKQVDRLRLRKYRKGHPRAGWTRIRYVPPKRARLAVA